MMCVGISHSMGQTANTLSEEPMQEGIYSPTWQSLAQYETPEWFRNAKFGIWAHWGPQCEPEAGDWYARFMYYQGSGQYNYHVSKYGNPAVFGFKDVINAWKADQWDPDSLVRFYKRVGARYFMALGNHHDNMDLWDSKYQPWNSVNMGPKRDVVGGWAEACKKYGIPLGVSIHASHAWTWMEPSQDYDGKLTKADGVGKWWEGYDPQDLYAQNHPRSVGSENSGTIHSQWEWGAGAAQPSKEYVTKFYNRTLDVINRYNPDLIYFDDTALPFTPINDAGLKIAAHLYNKSLKDHQNQMNAVIMAKKLSEEQKEGILWDVERGIPDRPQEKAWQTCTCIGDWHYNRGIYNNNGYKSAATVVKMLVDIVSKNGNLLLSIPVRGNGTIDEKEVNVLNGIKAWMDINSESIYDTRPWTTFGEGPTADASNPINNQGFNEGTNYTAEDIRFVQKDGFVYVTVMGWPSQKQLTVRTLSSVSPYYTGKIKSVQLLGTPSVEYTCDREGLKVNLPSKHPNEIAFVLKVGFTTEVTYDDFKMLREEAQNAVAEAQANIGTNTGQYDGEKVTMFETAIGKAGELQADAPEADVQAAYLALQTAFSEFVRDGHVKGGAADEAHAQNVTVKYLKEARNFSRSDAGTASASRFGLLGEPWVVTPSIINQENNTRGGFDAYVAWNVFTGRAIGVQKWNITDPAIENGMIYQVTKLPAGSYNLKMSVHEQAGFKPGEAYLNVVKGNVLPKTQEVKEQALTYYDMSSAVTGKQYTCCAFELTEETEICIGWSVSLAASAAEHSMRVNDIRLLKDSKDVSAIYLKNYTNIQRRDVEYKRFGKPTHWTTENFTIPQSNSDGIKQGIDKFPGYNTLMMGVWNDLSRASGDLGNAKLYRKVSLPAGTYFFGASYESLYQVQKGYLFASYEVPTFTNVGKKALAYYDMGESETDGKWYGLTFTIPQDTTLYIGWVNNFKTGSTTQEFRVREVALLRYPESPAEWVQEEAFSADRSTLELTMREFAKVTDATYVLTPDNEAFITGKDGTEVCFGQVDMEGVSKVFVRTAYAGVLGANAAYEVYVDDQKTPWISLPAVKTERSNAFIVSEKEVSPLTGVHTLRVVFKGHASNLLSVGLMSGTTDVKAPVLTGESVWSMYSEKNTLHIQGLHGEWVTISDVAGNVVYSSRPEEPDMAVTLPESASVYVVRIGDCHTKISVND